MPGAPSQCECGHLCPVNRGPGRQVKLDASFLPVAPTQAGARAPAVANTTSNMTSF